MHLREVSLIDGRQLAPKLPLMSSRRFHIRAFWLVFLPLLVVGSACERKEPATRADSMPPAPEGSTPAAGTSGTRPGWDAAVGPVLLIQGEGRNEAIVLLPSESGDADARLRDLSRQGARVSLFGRGGVRMSGVLSDTSESDPECRVRPLRDVRAEGNAESWAVGFVGEGRISPLAMDSVDVLSGRDSTALVAEASRLASAVTAVTSSSFQGLRFTVHDVRRFDAGHGVQAIVARLARKVNQEANPQEEQTLLIAERDSGVTSGPYTLAFAERTHALEEQSITPEVIAGVIIAGRPTLIVARDGDEGVAYVMIERTGAKVWRVRWTSALTRCG
jgi:hypothetical protein